MNNLEVRRNGATGRVDHVDVRTEDLRQEICANDLFRCTELDDLAVLDRADVVGVARSKVDVVQHNDDGAAHFLGSIVQVTHHVHGVGDVCLLYTSDAADDTR